MIKLTGVLGFAAKAGKIVSGATQVEIAVLKKQVKLVICERDLSVKTIRGFEVICQKNGIPFTVIDSGSNLGNWIGKPGRKILGITSAQFAGMILQVFNEKMR